MEPLPPGIVPNFPPEYPFQWQQKIMPQPHPNHLRSMGLPASFSGYKRPNPGYGGYNYCKQYNGNKEQGEQSYHYEEEGEEGYDHGEEGEKGYDHGEEGEEGYHYGQEGEQGYYYEEENEQGYGQEENAEQNYNDNVASYTGEEEEAASNWLGSDAQWDDDDGDEDGQPRRYEGSQGGRAHRGQVYPSGPAPAPSSHAHYYNLAPTPQQQQGRPDYSQQSAADKKRYLQRRYGNRFCEVCEVGFYCLAEFKQHLSDHAKCPYHGCSFEGSIRKLDLHLTQKHLRPAAISDEDYIRRRRERLLAMIKNPNLSTALVEQQLKRGELLGVNHKPRGQDEDAHRPEKDLPVQDPTHVNSKDYEMLDTRRPNCKRKRENAAPGKRNKPPVIHEKMPMPTFGLGYVNNLKIASRSVPFNGIDSYHEETGQKSLLSNKLAQNTEKTENFSAIDISDEEDYVAPGKGLHIDSTLPTDHLLRTQPINPSTASVLTTSSNDAVDSSSTGGTTNTVEPGAKSAALGLLMEGYGSETDHDEDENSTEVTVPVAGCPATCVPPAASTGDGTAACDNTTAGDSTAAGDNTTAGDNTAAGDSMAAGDSTAAGDGISDGSSLVTTSILSVSGNSRLSTLDSDSDTTLMDDEGCLSQENPRNRRRRGKRGKRKSKKAKTDDTSSPPCDPATKNESVTGEPATKNESVSCLWSQTKVVALTSSASLAPHLKPINKRPKDSVGDAEDDASYYPSLLNYEREQKFAAQCIARKQKRFRQKYRQSLLEKLLVAEVQHERNVLLQCVKYIVEHNFFEDRSQLAAGGSASSAGGSKIISISDAADGDLVDASTNADDGSTGSDGHSTGDSNNSICAGASKSVS